MCTAAATARRERNDDISELNVFQGLRHSRADSRRTERGYRLSYRSGLCRTAATAQGGGRPRRAPEQSGAERGAGQRAYWTAARMCWTSACAAPRRSISPTFHHRLDGGIMVTASHNPMDYNGMKLVREQAKPISGDTGLFAIRDLAARRRVSGIATDAAALRTCDRTRAPTSRHLLGYVDPGALKPLKIVVNAGNGGAGPVIDAAGAAPALSVHQDPPRAGRHFPQRHSQSAAAGKPRRHRAGGARHMARIWGWPGTAILTAASSSTSSGEFIEGYYLVGLLAEALLAQQPGAKIIHDPRLTWNTIDMVRAGRRHTGAEQDRPCLHQGADAAGGCALRRRDERPSLFPRLRLLRQRHDPLAAGRGTALPEAVSRCRHWWMRGCGRFRAAARSTSG